MNLAVRPDPLAYGECFLKGFVGAGGGHAGIQCHLVGGFHLAEDFRFPQHHGVQPAEHAAQVLQGEGPLVAVEMGGHVHLAAAVSQEVGQDMLPGVFRVVRPVVDFHAVAGGEHHALFHARQFPDAFSRILEPVGRHGEPLPYFHGGGPVIQA